MASSNLPQNQQRLTEMKKYLLIGSLLLQLFCAPAQAKESSLTELRVQLPWMHQSQFTGLYVAQMRKHFEKEGLQVKLIEGAPEINAAAELRDGRVDIAITGLGGAWKAVRQDSEQITNVAQIINGSAYVVVCRISSGVYGPKDIPGKKIGLWSFDEKPFLEEMLRKLLISPDSVEFVIQKHDGSSLVDSSVACATSMIFDEYLNVIQRGVPYSDLIVIDPMTLGMPALLDGVYVDAKRLEDKNFRKILVGFVRALREGWRETRIAPTLSLEAVRSVSKTFDKEHQLRGLESMLTIIAADPKKFGLLDLKMVDQESSRYIKQKIHPDYVPEKIWTHQIWNELQEADGQSTTFTVATKYYVDHISHLLLFKIFVYFGVFTYALSGVLEAINRNYDLWGRLILAFLSGIGGGTIRDLIIGGDRLPFYYVKDYSYPLGIFIVVLIASIVAGIYPNAYKGEMFKKVKKYSDVFGFSALAVAGAIYAVTANMPWYWVPALAALTCAGGGMLRDIVINQEPATFKGVIYEEAAVMGGLFMVLGLVLANSYEHSSTPVYLTIIFSLVLIVSLRLAIYKFHWEYPKYLGGGSGAAH